MSTVFNLHVLSSDCFISGTVRMPAIMEVGPDRYYYIVGRDQLIPQQLCLCYGIIFYNFYIGLDCFS